MFKLKWSVLIQTKQGGISLKKLVSILSALMLIFIMGVSGEAASNSQSAPMPPKMTEEQKQEFQAKYKEAQEKFNALSTEQKNELYDLYDKVNVAKVKLLDKYVELGLLSKEEAEAIQKHMAQSAETARHEQQFIGIKGVRPPKIPAQSTEPAKESKTE